MSYKSGMNALNLKMTDRVPRTEYSAENHWPLVKAVTGIDTEIEENRKKASKEFIREWDYAFKWDTPYSLGEHIQKSGFGTSMGHAEYAEGVKDFSPEVNCPFKTVEAALSFDPCKVYGEFEQAGLVKKLNAIYRENKDSFGGSTVTMGGVYHTLFSGLIEIFGWEMLLLALGTDEKKFNKVVESYFNWSKQFFEAWAKTGIEVFMCHDDICWSNGPVAAPAWYKKNIFPYYKKLWQPLLAAGKKLIFTSDGKYDMFYEDITGCGAGMLVFEPYNDMELFAKKFGRTHGFVGNADTRILLLGTKEDIYREVERCINTGKTYPGFILAVGNHIPVNTPVENALYYNEAYVKLSKR